MSQIEVGDPQRAIEVISLAITAMQSFNPLSTPSERRELQTWIDQLEKGIDWRVIPGFKDYEINTTGKVRFVESRIELVFDYVLPMDEPAYDLQNDLGGWQRVKMLTLLWEAFGIDRETATPMLRGTV